MVQGLVTRLAILSVLGMWLGTSGTAAWAANPQTIYVYPYGVQHGESFMASLSGIVARTSPEVFMAVQGSNPNYDPEFWLNQYVANHPGTNVVWQNSLSFYIDRYKDKLSGYVVYDDNTLNEATSVSGALGAVMVHESLLRSTSGPLAAAGLSRVEDVRGHDSTWVFNEYGSQFSKDMIFRQPNTLSYNQRLRSFAILNKGFMFDATGATRDMFLDAQNPNGRVFGWGYGGSEFEFFDSASDRNLMGVPTDHLHGSAASAKWEVDIPEQPHHTPVETPTDPDKHYVAFVMSDGDNVQWLTNDFARSTRWFASPDRGDFDFTFDMSPTLADVNPVAVKYLYDEAAQDEHKTFFVTPGGQGLAYPSQVPDIGGMMDVTIPAMQAVDHNIISVLEDAAVNTTKLGQMVERPDVMGLMLKTGTAYAGENGKIRWHNGKPIVSVKYTLWENVNPPNGVNTVNEMIAALNGAPRDALHDQASYSIVNVHPWSTSTEDGGTGNPMANVHKIVAALGDSVEVVTLEELMIHLRNNFGTTVGKPIGQNLISNGDFEIPKSGSPDRPLNWFYSPATELAAGDSDGTGEHAAAIDALNSDWRSRNFRVATGERLRLAFDFKFNGVPDGSRFRADARFFNDAVAFVGETVEFLDAAQYEAGTWHTFQTDVIVPAGGTLGDVRFSTLFGPFTGGQVLIDNVRLLSNLPLAGDYNGDGAVDAADYTIWRDSLGKKVVPYAEADGDGDGVVAANDYTVWKSAFGTTRGGSAAKAGTEAVPEPAAGTALIPLWFALARGLLGAPRSSSGS